MSTTTPSTPPPTTTTFPSTTPSTTPGASASPSASPKPKEKWTTRVGTLVKRRSTGRRASLSRSTTTTPTPGDVSDSASEREKISLVDNLVRKASRRLSFSRTSTAESTPAHPKKKPSIDLQRSVTVDVDLPTTTSTSSLSLEPPHQVNGGVKALLAADIPSPIAESPLREADAVMRDSVANAEGGGRAGGGRFISMSSMNPQSDVPAPVPSQPEPAATEEHETAEEQVYEPVVPLQVPTIAIQSEESEPITPPALPIPPILPYVAPVQEDVHQLQPLENDAADHELEESMVIVDHPDDEDAAPVDAPIVEEIVAPIRIPSPELEKSSATPVTTQHEVVDVIQPASISRSASEEEEESLSFERKFLGPNIPNIPNPNTSESSASHPIAPHAIVEKSISFRKSSPTPYTSARAPTPPPSAPHTWSPIKIASSLVAASVAIALGAYALVRTGVVPASALPWFTINPPPVSPAGASVAASSSSSAAAGLTRYIPDVSFLSAFPFSLGAGWASSSTSAGAGQAHGERGWGAEGIAIAADAASLVVDAAVDSVSGGGGGGVLGGAGGVISGSGGASGIGGAVAGTGVLAVLGAGLAKFGSVLWAPWRAQRRGA